MLMSISFSFLTVKLSHVLMLVALQIQCDNHINIKIDSIVTKRIGNGDALLWDYYELMLVPHYVCLSSSHGLSLERSVKG